MALIMVCLLLTIILFGINVPENNFTLNPEQLAELRHHCNPCLNDDNFGINHFMYVSLERER